MFEKDMKISLLIDFYGDVLSDKRKEMISLYYNEDYSLSEISENMGISRQGVRESIKKSEALLNEFEEKLGLLKRFDEIIKDIDLIKISIQQISDSIDDENIKSKLSETIKKLSSISI